MVNAIHFQLRSPSLCVTSLTVRLWLWFFCGDVSGQLKTSTNQSDLVSGISSVVDRIRQDAYNGDFDAVLERHSLASVDVIGHVQDPSFLCQPGSVLRHQICGICRFRLFQIVIGVAGCDLIRYSRGSLTSTERRDGLKQRFRCGIHNGSRHPSIHPSVLMR